MSEKFDAIVIGAGHNGLSAAASLAARGKSVCVLERADYIGGMASDRMAHLLYNPLPRGVQAQTRKIDTVSLSPDGKHVVLRDGIANYASGDAHPDATAFKTLHDRLVTYAALLNTLAESAPPGLDQGLTSLAGLREMSRLAKLGIGVKRLGKPEMREFLRILLTNVYDLLLDEMPDGPLPGALASDAVRGAFAGPRSPGTVLTLMYRLRNGGSVSLPTGGMGTIANAYADAARKAGADIRCGVGVTEVNVEDDIVLGVTTSDGGRLLAPAVLSSAGPMQTMQMAGIPSFDIEAVRRARNLRAKGTTAKLNIALKGRPEFNGLTKEQSKSRLLIAPSVAEVERAFNPAKYGELPSAPSLEMVMPHGQDRLSVIVSHVPLDLKSGWTEKARGTLTETVIAAIEAYAPGLRDQIASTDLLTPADIAQLTGAPGGHWHHAEMGLDQMLTTRPTVGMARYRFGVRGLYLCGASAHPGGDVTGMPGRNSAAQVLLDGVA